MTAPVAAELDVAGVFAALLTRMGEAAPQPRLAPTRRALELLDDPHTRFPLIHITGTNGKTSTSRMAAELLRRHGLHVGLFTSPHLIRFAERIALDGTPASDVALGAAWRHVEPALGRIDAELHESGEPAMTFFEALTVLAYQVFAAAGVDAAVIEVGMGGEWDSTNVADGRVAVLTPISLDHTRQLGSTVERIAQTKSGIIKPGAIVVTADQPDGALAQIVTRAESVGAPVLVAGRHFSGRSLSRTPNGQRLEVMRIDGSSLPSAELPLHGDHQAANAAVAVAAVDAFLGSEPGFAPMSAADVADALAAATSPGRLQVMGRDPLVILDAAHNPAGALSLAAALRDWPDLSGAVFVLGVLEEKDAIGIIRALLPVASAFYVTQSASPRAIGHGTLSRAVAQEAASVPVHDMDDPAEAVAAALDWARAHPHTAVVITGSITLIGDALDRARTPSSVRSPPPLR